MLLAICIKVPIWETDLCTWGNGHFSSVSHKGDLPTNGPNLGCCWSFVTRSHFGKLITNGYGQMAICHQFTRIGRSHEWPESPLSDRMPPVDPKGSSRTRSPWALAWCAPVALHSGLHNYCLWPLELCFLYRGIFDHIYPRLKPVFWAKKPPSWPMEPWCSAEPALALFTQAVGFNTNGPNIGCCWPFVLRSKWKCWHFVGFIWLSTKEGHFLGTCHDSLVLGANVPTFPPKQKKAGK